MMLTYRDIAEQLIAIYQETGKYAFDREQFKVISKRKRVGSLLASAVNAELNNEYFLLVFDYDTFTFMAKKDFNGIREITFADIDLVLREGELKRVIVNLKFPEINHFYGEVTIDLTRFKYAVILPKSEDIKPTRHKTQESAIKRFNALVKDGFLSALIISDQSEIYTVNEKNELIQISD